MTIKFKKISQSKPGNDLIKFLKIIFPDIDVKKWTWEYRNNPEKEGLVWIVKKGNSIIAHYAFILGYYYFNKKLYLVAKAEGSLADIKSIANLPKKDRRVFKKLVEVALKDLKNKKIDFVYGFPNSLAIQSQINAGYKLSKVPIYLSNLILDLNEFLVIKNKKLFSSNITFVISNIWKLFYKNYFRMFIYKSRNVIEYNDNLELELKKYLNSLKGFYKNGFLEKYRSFSYLKWRFLDNPYKICRIGCLISKELIIGYVVVSLDKKVNTKCSIMDIKADSEKNYKPLLIWAIDFALKNNSINIDFWGDENLKNNKSLKYLLFKLLFFKRFKKVEKKFIIKSFNNNLNEEKINFNTMRYMERL